MIQPKEDYSSFKIKKKVRKESDSSIKKIDDENIKSKKEENIINLKLKSLNYKEVYEKILEDASKNNDNLEIIKTIISQGLSQLNNKKDFYMKKWKHLRSANFDENEYRNNESKLKKEEKEEISYINKEMIKNLSIARIYGFNTKEFWLQKEFQKYKTKNYNFLVNNNYGIKNFQIDPEYYKRYKESQYCLIDKMIKTNIFIDTTKNIENNMKPNFSTQLNIETKEREVYNDNTKVVPIKLSHILGDFDFKPQNTDLLEVKEEDIMDINIEIYNKIKDAKNEKSYYKKKIVKNQFKELKNVVFKLNGLKNIDELSNKDLQSIVDLVSFCSNSIHYYTKFDKKQFIIHPDDILKIINNLLKDKQSLN